MIAFFTQRRWALDALIVVVIIGLSSLRAPDDLGDLESWLFTIALALPLLWRRRAPAVVFAVIALVALAAWLLDIQAFGSSALLVALYTLAVQGSVRTLIAAAAVLELGVLMASLRWAPHHHPEDAFVALTGLAVAAGVLGLNVRHRQSELTSLQERAARLEAERDLAAVSERSRIAREMHDIVAHNLSVMIALADGAVYALHDEPESAELALRKAGDTGREALTEMRRLLGVLRDDDGAGARAPQPGIGQLDALVEQVRAAGIPTTLTISGVPPAHISRGLQLAAYRIVQEALTNALKYGGLSASVLLRWAGPKLQLEVVNRGPVVETVGEGGGLRGMRERAAVCDGTVEAGPQRAGGWRVFAELFQPVEVAA